jgi:hypothetical protein
MADAVGSIQRTEADNLLEIAQFTFGPANLQIMILAYNSNAGRIVATVFELPQTINN